MGVVGVMLDEMRGREGYKWLIILALGSIHHKYLRYLWFRLVGGDKVPCVCMLRLEEEEKAGHSCSRW